MSFQKLLAQMARIHRQVSGNVDRYGNPTVEYQPQQWINIRVEEQPGSENTDDRETSTRTAVAWTDYGQFDTDDRIVFDGTTWELTAPPVIVRGRSGRDHHYMLRLRAVQL